MDWCCFAVVLSDSGFFAPVCVFLGVFVPAELVVVVGVVLLVGAESESFEVWCEDHELFW